MYDSNRSQFGNLVRSVLLVVSVGGLAACGGGGGDGGDDRTGLLNDSGTEGGGNGSGDTATLGALPMSTSSDDTSVTDAAVSLAFNEGAFYLGSTAGIFETVLTMFSTDPYLNQPCGQGGTETLKANRASPDVISEGDSFVLRFASCAGDEGVTDGTISVSVAKVGFLNDAGLTPEQRLLGAKIRIVFKKLTETGLDQKIDGDLALSADDTLGFGRFLLTGSSIARTTGIGNAVKCETPIPPVVNARTTRLIDYTIWGGFDANGVNHVAVSYGLESTRLGGLIAVDTSTPFEILSGDANFSIGVATITGKKGNGATMTVLDSSQVQVDYEFDGNGQFDDYTAVKSWEALLNVSATTSRFMSVR